MPNLIDKSFFVRDILIPNAKDDIVAQKINSAIQKYERECLLNVLGYSLYKVYLSEDSQRMTDLKTGKDDWQGLVHDTDISLIAYYTYYHIKENEAQQTTGINTAVGKTENSISVSPVEKMINSWNNFSEEVDNLLSFLWNNQATYPEFTYSQYWKVKREFRKNNEFGF